MKVKNNGVIGGVNNFAAWCENDSYPRLLKGIILDVKKIKSKMRGVNEEQISCVLFWRRAPQITINNFRFPQSHLSLYFS